jgi:hypothetical protein
MKLTQHVLLVVGVAIGLNVLFALFLLAWVNDRDISNLPPRPFDRFITLFYFSVMTFTTTGYGDILPRSRRARIAVSFFTILLYAGIVGVATH